MRGMKPRPADWAGFKLIPSDPVAALDSARVSAHWAISRLGLSQAEVDPLAQDAATKAAIQLDPKRATLGYLRALAVKIAVRDANKLKNKKRKEALASTTGPSQRSQAIQDALPQRLERRGQALELGRVLQQWVEQQASMLDSGILWGRTDKKGPGVAAGLLLSAVRSLERRIGEGGTCLVRTRAGWGEEKLEPLIPGFKFPIGRDFDIEIESHVRRFVRAGPGKGWTEGPTTRPRTRRGRPRIRAGARLPSRDFPQERKLALEAVARKALALVGIPGARFNKLTNGIRKAQDRELKAIILKYFK